MFSSFFFSFPLVKINKLIKFWEEIEIHICSDRFARRPVYSPGEQAGLADTVDALASKPEWGRNARMKISDSAGWSVGIHEMELYHFIS